MVEDENFEYELLLGLDCITTSKLCRDHNLIITQASESDYPKKIEGNSSAVSVFNNDVSHLQEDKEYRYSI